MRVAPKNQQAIPSGFVPYSDFLMISVGRHQAAMIFYRTHKAAQRQLQLARARVEATIRSTLVLPRYKKSAPRLFEAAYYVDRNVLVAWAFPNAGLPEAAVRNTVRKCLRR